MTPHDQPLEDMAAHLERLVRAFEARLLEARAELEQQRLVQAANDASSEDAS